MNDPIIVVERNILDSIRQRSIGYIAEATISVKRMLRQEVRHRLPNVVAIQTREERCTQLEIILENRPRTGTFDSIKRSPTCCSARLMTSDGDERAAIVSADIRKRTSSRIFSALIANCNGKMYEDDRNVLAVLVRRLQLFITESNLNLLRIFNI